MNNELLLVIGLFVTLSSCSQEQGSSELRTVFDQSEIKLISQAARNSNSAFASVGNIMVKMENPERPNEFYAFAKCTGIQVSPTHVLTAGHCAGEHLIFDKNQIAKSDDSSQLTYQAFDHLLRLGFDGEKIAAADLAPTKSILSEVFLDVEADIAIYESKDNLGADFFRISENREQVLPEDRPMMVIGHPNGVPLSMADQCLGSQSHDGTEIRHDCDALTGSSGGLILQQTEAGQSVPVGIHLAGPMQNDGAYFSEKNRFESSEEIAEAYGCTEHAELNPLGLSYELCVKNFGRNKGLGFVALRKLLDSKNPRLLESIDGRKSCSDTK